MSLVVYIQWLIAVGLVITLACAVKPPKTEPPKAESKPAEPAYDPMLHFDRGAIVISDEVPGETPVCFDAWRKDPENVIVNGLFRRCIPLSEARKLAAVPLATQ